MKALIGHNSSGAAEVPLNITLHPAIPYTKEQYSSYPYEMPSNPAVGMFEVSALRCASVFLMDWVEGEDQT